LTGFVIYVTEVLVVIGLFAIGIMVQRAQTELAIGAAIGATHHLFIATNSAPQKFRILRIMGGTNCEFGGTNCEFLSEDWTTPQSIEMVVTSNGHLRGRCDGGPSFKAFLSASEELEKNIHGVRSAAELDGGEIGFLVAKMTEIKSQK